MTRRDLLRLAAGAPLLGAAGCSRGEWVTLYCAQDREFAEGLLGEFGTEVRAKYDSEANKSVALVEELRRERGRPRCDVHWNNEPLGTLRLAAEGVLEPYRSPAGVGFPAWTRPADGTWQAFAARARVILVNTRLVPASEYPTSILDLADARWRGRLALAKPVFGTSATHAAALFAVLGPERAERWYADLKAGGAAVVAGNKQVAQGVAAGDFALGVTDTDDALIELRAGRPVALVYPDRDGHPAHPGLGTLFIPNTLALVRGAPHADTGRRLMDWLLRPQTERRLATGGGFQIPLNPAAAVERVPGLETPATVRPMAVDWAAAAIQWDASQTILRRKFLA